MKKLRTLDMGDFKQKVRLAKPPDFYFCEKFLYLKLHHIAVLNDIILAFGAQCSQFAGV